MTSRTTSRNFRRPRSCSVFAWFDAVLGELAQCCDEDAGVLVYHQLHLDLWFCLYSHPASRLRRQKQACSFAAHRVVQEKNTNKTKNDRSNADIAPRRRSLERVRDAQRVKLGVETDTAKATVTEKKERKANRDEVQARRPTRMITLLSLVTCGVVPPVGLSPVFIPQP